MEVRNTQLGGLGRSGQATPLLPGSRPNGKSDAKSARNDVVEISSQARQAVKVHGFAQQVLAIPDTRPAVVLAARQALESGQLDSPGAIEATAQAIAQAF